SNDTDVMIAMVSSLLDNPLDGAAILDALISCDGDVEAAAKSLKQKKATPPKVSGSKRKRDANLEGWLQ
ncbi:hypothetical protein GGG16DRAFT_41197, partial [Schizophyllum commune]